MQVEGLTGSHTAAVEMLDGSPVLIHDLPGDAHYKSFRLPVERRTPARRAAENLSASHLSTDGSDTGTRKQRRILTSLHQME